MRPSASLVLLVCACGGGAHDDPSVDGVSPPDTHPAGPDGLPPGVCPVPCTADCGPDPIVAGDPWAVALDATHVYWTDRFAGTLSRRARGGGPVELLATGMSDPDSIALDGDHVYVVDYGTQLNSSLRRVPASGGAPSLVGVIGGLGGALAFDADRVYVARWGKSGDPGGIVSFLKGGGGMTTVLTEVGVIAGMVLEGNTIYFAGGTQVGRAPMDGGPVTMLATMSNPIELHAWGDNLYVNEIQPPEVPGPTGLWRVAKTGGQTQLLDTYVDDFAVDDCGIVWSEGYGGIKAMGLDGTGVHAIANDGATSLAIGREHVFWADHTRGVYVAPR